MLLKVKFRAEDKETPIVVVPSSFNTITEAELEELLQKNPEICIVTNELGYGVVPIEPFDRKWREKTGRICTELAAKADSVTRVVCGIGILLKGEEKHD